MRSRSRGPGSWRKCISSSREIHRAMGSFDCVRLAPHCPQDDRELELGRVDTSQKRIASGGSDASHAYIWLPASWWKCISSSREIHRAMGSFDSVRLGAHSAQDDRELELGRVDTFQKRIVSGGPMRAMPMYGFPLRGGNAYLVLARSTQQGGLSTPFGWRLTALKMTENQNCERSVRLAPHCAPDDRGLELGKWTPFRSSWRLGAVYIWFSEL